jgi:hypothetical protein
MGDSQAKLNHQFSNGYCSPKIGRLCLEEPLLTMDGHGRPRIRDAKFKHRHEWRARMRVHFVKFVSVHHFKSVLLSRKVLSGRANFPECARPRAQPRGPFQNHWRFPARRPIGRPCARGRAYVFSGERMPLAGRCRRLAENFVPHASSGEAREFVERESGGPPDSARGPRALPGVSAGTLNMYGRAHSIRWRLRRAGSICG